VPAEQFRHPSVDPVISALEVLGLKPGATHDEIQDAFRRLSLRVHPDVCPTGGGLFRVLLDARDSALGSGNSSLAIFHPPGKKDEPDPLQFSWFRAQPGLIQAGAPDGMLTAYRFSDGTWSWSIPGGHANLHSCRTSQEARDEAEKAYLKYFCGVP
jgi:hypothetical protein